MDVLDNNDFNNADNKAMPYAQKWALYGVAVAVIGGLLAFSFLGVAAFIGAIVMATRERAKDFGRGFSFGKAWGTGALTGVIFAVLVGIWVFIYMNFIDPGSVDAAQMVMEAEWEKQGMSEEQMEQAAGWANMFTGAGPAAIMGAIGYSLFGMLISLITGAILKKD